MKKTPALVAACLGAALLVLGCATGAGGISAAEADRAAADMVKSAFRTQGIAKVERVTEIDETLQLIRIFWKSIQTTRSRSASDRAAESEPDDWMFDVGRWTLDVEPTEEASLDVEPKNEAPEEAP